jgi:hypothetical protein
MCIPEVLRELSMVFCAVSKTYYRVEEPQNATVCKLGMKKEATG